MKIVWLADVQYLVLTWDDIERLVDKLAIKIESNYEPDMLVGMERGGATVAHLLSDRLDIYEVRAIGIRSYTDIGKRGEFKVYQNLPKGYLKEHRVLLVDDVADSGSSLKFTVEKLIKPKRPKDLRTATLHIKPRSTYIPDYYVSDFNGWIVYPWEKNEISKKLMIRLSKRYGSEIAHRLIVKDLGMPSDIADRALKFLGTYY